MKLFITTKDGTTYTYENVKAFDYTKHFDTAYIVDEFGNCIKHENIEYIGIDSI